MNNVYHWRNSSQTMPSDLQFQLFATHIMAVWQGLLHTQLSLLISVQILLCFTLQTFKAVLAYTEWINNGTFIMNVRPNETKIKECDTMIVWVHFILQVQVGPKTCVRYYLKGSNGIVHGTKSCMYNVIVWGVEMVFVV